MQKILKWTLRSPAVYFEALRIIFFLSFWSLGACATRYRFISQPDGATVHHKQGDNEALLGTTPAQIDKSTLPDDQPFFVVYRKPGFQTLEILISPTDQSLTTVYAQMVPEQKMTQDPQLTRTRKILKTIFKLQEHAVKQQMTDALAIIKQLEVEEPLLAETHMLKGSLYCALNDLLRCAEAWEKALSLDPELDGIRVRLKNIKDALKEAP
jgi:tetratricopeptide (TPR) repeat protein